MQSSCEALCCSTRSRNQSPGVTHHKFPTDERWKFRSHEKFRSLHRIPYFVPFIYRIFKPNWSIQNKNLGKTPKYDSSSQESSTSQLGGSIGVAKFAKSSSSSRSETANAWWHEKEVLLHRRSPNFELVEINSTLSCKELSVSKFKRIFKDAKTDECLTDAAEAFEIVSTWNWR